MSRTPKIIAISGSLRKGSYNKKMIQIAAKAALSAGAEVRILDLADLALPLFNEDLEKDGVPQSAYEIKAIIQNADGLLIASPEYNGSITAPLKNALDWASRSDHGEPPKAAFVNKIAAIMSASPSGFGGVRGLAHLRSILNYMGVIVLPEESIVSAAHKAFHEDGSLIDLKRQAALEAVACRLVKFLDCHF